MRHPQPLKGIRNSKKYKYLFSINFAFKNGFLLSHILYFEHSLKGPCINIQCNCYFFIAGTTSIRPRGWACVVGHAWFDNNFRQVTKGDIRDSVFEEDNMEKRKVPFFKEIFTISVKLNKKENTVRTVNDVTEGSTHEGLIKQFGGTFYIVTFVLVLH